ncbi:MAG: sensor histidine kinase, partial [Candidatus Spyradocola sp.]
FFDMPVVDTWLFLIPLLYALLFFADAPGIRLLWWAILTVLFNGLIMLCLSLFTVVTGGADYMQQASAVRLVFMLLANVMVTVGLYFVVRIRRGTRVGIWPLLIFALMNLLAEGILDVLFALHRQALLSDALLLTASAMTLGISLLSISLFSTMSRYAERLYEARRAEDLRRMEQQRTEELNATCASLHSLRHDLKNHLSIARSLIESGRESEGAQYLAGLDERIFSVYDTGCAALDSALTLKELRMRQSQITFRCTLCPLDALPLSDLDLCAVVTNLLDNAIEAIERAPAPPDDPCIEFTIRRVRGMLYIECRNPADPATLRRDGAAFRTAKPDAHHGLGLRSIEAIVQKAHGTASFTCENATFTAFLALPC